MTDTTMYVIIGLLAVATLVLFIRSGSSRSLTEQKQDEVRRKRAALRAKRKAEAEAASKNEQI